MQTNWRTPSKPRSAMDKTARVQQESGEHSPTQQHQREDCDINKIVEKFKRGVPISHLRRGTPEYGDFTNAMDYLEASNAIKQAESSFNELPENIRERFSDAAELLEFIDDDSNREEAEALGLVQSTKPSPPQSKTVPTAPGEGPDGPATIPPLDGNGITDTNSENGVKTGA